MSLPCEIAAGATLLFSATLPGYPATLNSSVFVLNLEGNSVANIAGTASANDFVFTAPASTTSGWTPGRYFFAFYATTTADSSVHEVWSGQIPITPNFAASATLSPAQVQLAALDAAILKAVTSGNIASSSFNGQSGTARSLKELFDQRDRLQARVWAEQRAAGLSTKGGAKQLVTRFRNG